MENLTELLKLGLGLLALFVASFAISHAIVRMLSRQRRSSSDVRCTAT